MLCTSGKHISITGMILSKKALKQQGENQLVKKGKLATKKSMEAKTKIKKYNHAFGDPLNNEDMWNLIGISKMTFYKYKKELY